MHVESEAVHPIEATLKVVNVRESNEMETLATNECIRTGSVEVLEDLSEAEVPGLASEVGSVSGTRVHRAEAAPLYRHGHPHD